MRHLSLFRHLFGTLFQRPRRPRRRFRRREGVGAVEALEVRTLLTNFLVTTDADVVAPDGFVSLREAIQAANTNAAVNEAPAGEATGDAITFDASLAGGTIVLGGTELPLASGTEIDGADRGITIDANQLSRVFGGAINLSESVVLENLTLTNGSAVRGGAINVIGGGRLELNAIVISHCVASDSGGALWNAGSDVYLDKCGLFNNQADFGGGAVFATSGTTTISQTAITGNSAGIVGGGIAAGFSNGSLVSITLIDSTLDDNHVDSGNGGGLRISRDVTVTITRGTVSDNSAESGGGIWVDLEGTLTLDSTTLNGNSATGGIIRGPGRGGAILSSGGMIDASGATITNNTASGDGGGINTARTVGGGGELTLTNATFLGNVAGGLGGAVYNALGTATLTQITMQGNSAAELGGALYSINGAVTIDSRSLIYQNSAQSGGGVFTTGVLGTLDLEDPCVVFANTPDNFGGIQPADCDVHSEISGSYTIGGLPTDIVRSGNALSFINERGEVSRGRYLSRSEVVAIDWNSLTGRLVDGRIEWSNGSTWSDSIVGSYMIDHRFTTVEQSGEQLTFTNERGEVATGHFVTSTEVIAETWGDLHGTIAGGRIAWGNGSVWSAPVVPDVSADYFLASQHTNISRSGNTLLFTNERGEVSRGHYLSENEVAAVDWGGLVGEIDDGVIRWGNGSVWAVDISGEYTFNGQATSIAQAGNLLTFTNEHGSVSQGHFLNETNVFATDWDGLIGEIVNGRVEWRNGSLWQPKAGYASADAVDRLFASAEDDWLFLLQV